MSMHAASLPTVPHSSVDRLLSCNPEEVYDLPFDDLILRKKEAKTNFKSD